MIFVDTWAWVALADRTDQYHRQVKTTHRRLLRARQRYVTSDDVLGETITYLYDAIGSRQARDFITSIFTAADAGAYQLVHISPDHFRRAWQMRQNYDDKPDISFVDFTSMVVMQELGISEVFTGDEHFLHVGLGFRRVP